MQPSQEVQANPKTKGGSAGAQGITVEKELLDGTFLSCPNTMTVEEMLYEVDPHSVQQTQGAPRPHPICGDGENLIVPYLKAEGARPPHL